MGMLDINTIAERVQKEADQDANIIFGATVDEALTGKVTITIIATDFAGTGFGPVVKAPEVTKASFEGSPVEVDGMTGHEINFSDLVGGQNEASEEGAENSEPESFDIPDFLK